MAFFRSVALGRLSGTISSKLMVWVWFIGSADFAPVGITIPASSE